MFTESWKTRKEKIIAETREGLIKEGCVFI